MTTASQRATAGQKGGSSDGSVGAREVAGAHHEGEHANVLAAGGGGGPAGADPNQVGTGGGPTRCRVTTGSGGVKSARTPRSPAREASEQSWSV